MSSPIFRLRNAAPLQSDLDGYEAHPVDEIEPICEGRGYREICQDLMTSLNNSVYAIAEGKASAEGIGALWGVPAYQHHEPAHIPLEVDLEAIRQEASLAAAYLTLLPEIQRICSWIACKRDQVVAAWAIGAQLGLEFVGGHSLVEIGERFGKGRAAISNYVRGFQLTGFNHFTSDYQKPDSARASSREARIRYLQRSRDCA